MTSNYQDYQSWLQGQFGGSPTVFLDNLGDWLPLVTILISASAIIFLEKIVDADVP